MNRAAPNPRTSLPLHLRPKVRIRRLRGGEVYLDRLETRLENHVEASRLLLLNIDRLAPPGALEDDPDDVIEREKGGLYGPSAVIWCAP